MNKEGRNKKPPPPAKPVFTMEEGPNYVTLRWEVEKMRFGLSVHAYQIYVVRPSKVSPLTFRLVELPEFIVKGHMRKGGQASYKIVLSEDVHLRIFMRGKDILGRLGDFSEIKSVYHLTLD